MKNAVRMLLKTPGLSLVVILSLAVGIGANTVTFSWLRTVAFDPLSGVSGNVLALEARRGGSVYVGTSWEEYRELRELLPSFSGLLAHRPRAFNLGDSERDERIWAELVSRDFFTTLGVRPALGRFFLDEETTRPGAAPVAVIAHDFWQRKFRGAPDVIGRTLRLNNHTLTIVGVAPPRFQGGFNGLAFDVWVPLTMTSELQPLTQELTLRLRTYVMLGTLKPGVTPAHAQGEIAAAARTLATIHPDTNKDIAFDLLPLWRTPRGGLLISSSVTGLQALGLLVLIVVCVNTANLLLARATVRQREIGIRLAIGAGAGRIIRMLLTESLLLAFLGVAGGLLLAMWGIDLVKEIPLPTNWPIHFEPRIDAASLAFAVILGAGCGIAFGLAPAWQLARADVLQALRSGSQGAISGRSRLRSVLVAAEVAVALVLVVLSALFLRSFRNSTTQRPGFDVDRVLLTSVDLAGHGYTEASSRTFTPRLLARLAALPQVEAAALAVSVPLDVTGMPKSTVTTDMTRADPDHPQHTLLNYVSPGYFATLGMPFVAGHDLAPLEDTKAPLDAVVNEEFAARHWPAGANAPGLSPLNRQIKVGLFTVTVVGVVRNAKYETLSETPQPMIWISLRAIPLFAPTIHVRARGAPGAGAARADPLVLLPDVRAAVREIDPELSLYDSRTLAQHVDRNLFLQRVPATILSVLGPMALVLAAIGLYAVLAYALAQRTREIGVRLTLGATPRGVVLLMIRQGMRAVFAGAVVGLGLALLCGWYLQRVTVGVPIGDPLIYLGTPALLLVVAVFACWLPARKAAQVDPIRALRAE